MSKLAVFLDRPILSPNLKQRLADQRPTGTIVDPDVVQSWVDITWLSMLEYHPQGVSQRTIVSWWSRIHPDELERAAERLRVMRSEDEDRKLSSMLDDLNNDDRGATENADVVDLFARVRR